MKRWQNFKRYLRLQYLRLLRLRDQPEPLARGVALGFASGFGPFFGIGVLAAYAFAALLKGNRVAAVLTALMFKWAIPLFMATNMAIGTLVLGDASGYGAQGIQSHDLMTWQFWQSAGLAYVTGSAVSSTIAYGLTYYPVRRWALQRQQGRQQRRNAASSYVA
ncbi:DUF2062 domain-containing protein [Heliophilum fasciatum]|uniref:DUF2062 domain-containing protein n=1 Tax=Heliophilum fasciatum TaxID=35700 RepID=A0A4R2RPQ4_9FIRM|nr:DUF2062 domain-containing protein [Heliophilum fasciatum]MCW2277496.1 uncharacterized protein (DUF2062 family) [Heliophilum fasciatum]TCP65213.1 hypothetical protein EDD73_10697 [Heliophilum fasciatum]